MIADGYYLYRDRLKFAVDPGALGAGTLPPGKVKEDQFFGKVETYRNQLIVKLPLEVAAPGASRDRDGRIAGLCGSGSLLSAAGPEGNVEAPARRRPPGRIGRGGARQEAVAAMTGSGTGRAKTRSSRNVSARYRHDAGNV